MFALLNETISRAGELLRPPPEGHGGTWAEAHRRLPEGSPEPGPYRASRTPYLEAIYQAYADPLIEEVDTITGSQMGKTEAILNICGHRLHWGPRVPTLYVAPTQDMAKSVSEERAKRMILESPDLDALHEKGRRDRVAEKYIAGIRWGFAWAGSKAQLSSRPAGLAMIDELDRCEVDVEGEGSPVVLVRARGKNYPGFTLGTWTTPTLEDASAGQIRFDQGSREIWTWQCPACGERFVPWSKFLRWDSVKGNDPAAATTLAETTARLECPACGEHLKDDRKPALHRTGAYAQHLRDVTSGDYLPDPDPPPITRRRSFWITGTASPWMTFARLAGRLAAAYASLDPATIQATINVDCGELFRTRGDAPESDEVRALRVASTEDQVPEWVQAVTAGVDVQRDRLFYVVRGWGAGLSSHLLRHGEIVGETELDQVWVALATLLDRRWRGLPIVRMGVDSGYRPGETYRRPEHVVYSFAKRFPGRVYATKGHDRQGRPWQLSKLEKDGLDLAHLDTDHYKSWLHARIRWPSDADSGRWTLHQDTTDDYCDQIVAEHVVTKPSGARVWVVPRRKANHYFDAEVIARAMADLAHLELLTPKADTTAPAAAQPPKSRARNPSFSRAGLL